MLLAEILASVCLANTDSKRRVVIDLFAGHGSLRDVVKDAGLEYVAMDIKDLL